MGKNSGGVNREKWGRGDHVHWIRAIHSKKSEAHSTIHNVINTHNISISRSEWAPKCFAYIRYGRSERRNKMFSGPIWADTVGKSWKSNIHKFEPHTRSLERIEEKFLKFLPIFCNHHHVWIVAMCLRWKSIFFSAVVRQKRAVLWNVEREKFSGWKIWIINRWVRCTEMLSKKQRKLFLTVSIFDFSAQLLSFCRQTCASFERKVTAPQESSHIPHFHSYFFAAYTWDILHVFETRSGHGPEPVSCVAAKNV